MLLFVLYRVLYKCACHVLMFNINIINNLQYMHILVDTYYPSHAYHLSYIPVCIYWAAGTSALTDGLERIGKISEWMCYPSILCAGLWAVPGEVRRCAPPGARLPAARQISAMRHVRAPARLHPARSALYVVVSVCKTLILWVWQKINVVHIFLLVF